LGDKLSIVALKAVNEQLMGVLLHVLVALMDKVYDHIVQVQNQQIVVIFNKGVKRVHEPWFSVFDFLRSSRWLDLLGLRMFVEFDDISGLEIDTGFDEVVTHEILYDVMAQKYDSFIFVDELIKLFVENFVNHVL
jgi:hypothetical protein